jgi:hypothetical protein
MKRSEQLSNTLKIVMENSYDFDDLSEKVFKLSKNISFDFLYRSSQLSFYEGLVEIRKNSRKAIKKAKNSFSNLDNGFNRIIKSLNDLTVEELNSLYKEYKEEIGNEKILFLIQIFITKKEAIEWFAKIKKNDSEFIFFRFNKIVFERNYRFFFRKILSIHFKNLDDYHSYSIL